MIITKRNEQDIRLTRFSLTLYENTFTPTLPSVDEDILAFFHDKVKQKINFVENNLA